MTSQGKVEILRSGHDGFSRGDPSAMAEVAAADVDWGTSGAFPGLDPVYRGPEAMERWMDAVRSAWGWFEVTIDEVLREADDLLVVGERLRGRGRESGAEVDMCVYSVYWFEDDRIAKRRVFDRAEDALEAAALPG